MPGRRLLAGAAAVLLLPAGVSLLSTSAHSVDRVAAGTTSASALSAEPLAARKAKKNKKKAKQKAPKVTITSLTPPIAQQGRKTAGSAKAKAVTSVQVKPKKRNQKVVVQLSTGGGWKKAGQARTDKSGRAQVLVNMPANRVVTYRAKVGKGTSATVNNAAFARATFVDEFSGRSLSDKWVHRGQDYNAAGLRTCSRGNPRAVQVKGGAVRLSVMKDPNRKGKCLTRRNGKNAGKHAYRINGHISTEESYTFTHGYIAARIKFPRERGQHGSFWLQPDAPQPASHAPRHAGAEIDVVEYFGQGAPKGGLTSFTYHSNATGAKQKTGNWIKKPNSFLKNKKDAWHKNYHVFSMKWTPTSYTMYIDGKQSWHSTKGVSGVPQFPILSLLSSDYEISQLKGGDKKLPQHMFVDWIKVWETPTS